MSERAQRSGSGMRPATVSADGLPRPLTIDERALIEALLGGLRSGVGRYIDQLEEIVVVGRCRCGCPSINFATAGSAPEGRPVPLVLADAESPEGIQVGVILWVRNGRLSGLEVHPWEASGSIRLPNSETLHNLRTDD